jgi:hypothetical protein
MKNTCLTIIFTASVFIQGFSSCDKESSNPENTNTQYNENLNDSTAHKMKMKIGSKIFTVTFFDNETVNAFKAMLPITIGMSELNGNEKYNYLTATLPTSASNPGTINAGDLMLWGNNCIVIFYKTFKTSFSYTKIGSVDDVSDLEADLGSGNVTVTFEME